MHAKHPEIELNKTTENTESTEKIETVIVRSEAT